MFRATPPPAVPLIVLGAVKAGTTWLYDALAQHPDCHLREVKEVNYFLLLGQGADHWARAHKARDTEAMRARLSREGNAKTRARLAARIETREALMALPQEGADPAHQAYLAFLTEGRKRARVVADISPQYATLDRKAFAQMVALGPEVRLVYLLRDPVDRAWSDTRMWVSRRAQRFGQDGGVARMYEVFDTLLDGGRTDISVNGDYARTLEELEAVVPPAQLHLSFYEELFGDRELERLAQFLGIRRIKADARKRVHAGEPMPLDEGRRARAATVFAPQYRAVARRMERPLPRRWQENFARASAQTERQSAPLAQEG